MYLNLRWAAAALALCACTPAGDDSGETGDDVVDDEHFPAAITEIDFTCTDTWTLTMWASEHLSESDNTAVYMVDGRDPYGTQGDGELFFEGYNDPPDLWEENHPLTADPALDRDGTFAYSASISLTNDPAAAAPGTTIFTCDTSATSRTPYTEVELVFWGQDKVDDSMTCREYGDEPERAAPEFQCRSNRRAHRL